MLKVFGEIALFIFAWFRVLFYLTLLISMFAIPIAYLVCLFYNPSLTLVITAMVLFIIIYSSGHHGKSCRC